MSVKSGKSLVFKEVIYNDSNPRFVVFTIFDANDTKLSPSGSIVFYWDRSINHKINYHSNVEFNELDGIELSKAQSLATLILD